MTAAWSAGTPTFAVDGAGTLTAALPVLDAGSAALTLTFTLTADRVLNIVVTLAPGVPALAGFQAWSTS